MGGCGRWEEKQKEESGMREGRSDGWKGGGGEGG